MTTAVKGKSKMDRKIISISSKRQVTIPRQYFETLGFHNEAECSIRDGGIFIRPVSMESGVFAEQILADLIADGYSGDELLARFRENSRKVRPAVLTMIEEADALARSGTSISMEELFGQEDE